VLDVVLRGERVELEGHEGRVCEEGECERRIGGEVSLYGDAVGLERRHGCGKLLEGGVVVRAGHAVDGV